MSHGGNPPFRAEHVGSLLRPKSLLEARNKLERMEITVEQLREIEDGAIRTAVKRQEEIGLPAVTDGELRRGSWHMDFLCRIGGVAPGGTQLRPFHNETGDVRNEILLPKVIDHLHLEKPIFGEDFLFLKSISKAVPKLTIPAPSLLHGLGVTVGGNSVYRDEQNLLDDLIKVYAEQVRLLETIGCTYLQIDDTMFATLGDPSYRDKIRTTAGNPDTRHLAYIDLINGAIAKKSTNLTVCVHTCRGNHRSAWVASGGYDFVAEAVFNKLNVDGFFLEYDDARSGTFEPLRFVPKKKRIILGLVTSKKGQLENKEDLKRRIEAAARYVDMDQLSLSPQCGFASTLLGNLLTEEEQYAKLQLVVDTAREVWGNC
jgi:methionine synthase II (cobalamin-independent)